MDMNYRIYESYKNLSEIDDALGKKIKELYKKNIWNLEEFVKELEDYNLEINKSQIISWNNGIQYLDYKSYDDVEFNKISLESFMKGEYKETFTLDKKGSKIETEEKYAKRIIFYTKTLPNFKKYLNADNIEWVARENRQLFYDILKYHNDNNAALATIAGDIKAFIRVITLLLGDTNELKYKYSVLQTDLKEVLNLKESNNEVDTANELNTFVPYEKLLDICKKLENEYDKELAKYPCDGKKHPDKLFHIHQLLLAVSLFVYDYPSRDEKYTLDFIEEDTTEEGNYINVKAPTCKIILNNQKKKHEAISYSLNSKPIKDLNEKLCKLLKYSYKTYPRKAVFINKDGWSNQNLKKVNAATVSGWVSDIIPNKNLGINGFRSAFVSYYFNKFNNNSKTILKTRMRTSIQEIEKNYLKQYTYVEEPEPEKPKEIKSLNERRIDNFHNWYSKEENKIKHLEKVKEHSKKPEVYLKRTLRELNSGKLDFTKMKESTKEKYGIEFKNGTYYSTKKT